MTFQESIRICLAQKYADWHGRAGRAEFWWFFLFNVIVSLVASLVDAAIGIRLIQILVGLLLLLPNICVAIRRLHDTDRTGWWILIGLIPVIGWIVLLIFYLTPGQAGMNRYGTTEQAGAVA